jgi:hypothetical protein
MENNFDFKKYLAEGTLLKEDNLKTDLRDFIDSVEIDNYQRSDDEDYEEVEPTIEFFLDMYPEYENREEEIQQLLNSPQPSSDNSIEDIEDLKAQIKDLKTKYLSGDSSVLPMLKDLNSKLIKSQK